MPKVRSRRRYKKRDVSWLYAERRDPRSLRRHVRVYGVIVGGDHSSPAILKSHSWHPVPALIYGKYVRPDGIAEFGEHACARGSLGVLPATHIIRIALANAGRITKYGA